MERARCSLSLLQRHTLGKLWLEHESPKHLFQLVDAVLVFDGLRSDAVHNHAKGLESGRDTATQLINGSKRPLGGSH